MAHQSQRFTPTNRRHFLKFAGGAVALLGLSACGPAGAPVISQAKATPAPVTPQPGGVLRIAVDDDLTNFDPALVLSNSDLLLSPHLYDNLVRYGEDANHNPIHYPNLAEAWELSADALRYTFHLRRGVTFSHGTPFTAQDVAYTIQRILDPALVSPLASNLLTLAKVEVVDDYTVIFHLTQPDVALPAVLALSGMGMVPHDRTSQQLATEPAGTGPFTLRVRTPGERIVLQRNEHYWDPKLPYVNEVQFLLMPEPSARAAALSGDTVDLLPNTSNSVMLALANDPNVTLLESFTGHILFTMRSDHKPFDDVRVRQAFKHAIDRPALLQAILQGKGVVGNDQPIAPVNPFWANTPALAYDVEKAKQLLAAAGYTNGLTVTLTVAEIGPNVVEMAVVLQEMVKAAGITLTLDKTPVELYWDKVLSNAVFFADLWPVPSEPDIVLSLGYLSNGKWNISKWGSSQLDALIFQAKGERDQAKRKQLYAEVQRIISTEGAVLIPLFAPFYVATRANVHGIAPGEGIHAQFIWLSRE